MNLSRREMLAASALLLARPVLSPAAASTKPIILCWNENPYGPSPAARAVVSATIPLSCRYPDEENRQLIDAIAEHERIGADHLVLGTGSGELLRALGRPCAVPQGNFEVSAFLEALEAIVPPHSA